MAKVQEPNSEVFLMDYTKGLSSAPVRQSFNIATVVNAETGTTDRVTLTSVQDLVDTYMVGGSINQRSDQTIQCLGALLGHTTVDVIRLDTGNMRVGVGSLGNIFYCTDKYTPIDYVDFVPLTDAVNIDYPVLWMVIGDTLYYVGDKSLIPKDMGNTSEVDLYSTYPAIKIKSIDGGMIEEFFFGLELAGVSIYDSKSVSRFNEKIKRYAGDKDDDSGMPGFFNSLVNTYSNDQMRIYHSNKLSGNINNNEYITFDNYKFICITDPTSANTELENNIINKEIECYLPKDNKNINKEFLTRVFDKIFTKEVSITPPWGYDNEFKIKIPDGKIYLYGEFQSELYITVTINTDTGETRIEDSNRNTVFSHNATDLVSDTGYVSYLFDGIADENPNKESKNKYLLEKSCIIIKYNDKAYIFGPKGMGDSDIPSRAKTGGIVEIPTEQDGPIKHEIIHLPEKFTGQSALMFIWEYFNKNGMKDKIELNWAEGYNLDFVYRNVSNSPEIQTSEKVIFGEVGDVSYYEFKHESTRTNGNYATWPSLFFCVDNTCYHTGNRPELPGMSYTYINMGAGRYTIPDFLHNLFLNLKSDYIFGRVVDGFTQGFRLEGKHIYDWTGNPNAERNNVYNKGKWVRYENTDSGIALDVVGLPRTDDQTLYNDKFVCVGKFLTTGDQFKMEYTLNNDAYQTYSLNLTYKIDKEYQYKISFDPNAVDDFGTSLYYTIVNDSNVSNPYIFLYDRSGDIDPNYDGDTVFPNGFQYAWGSELENMKPDINDYVIAINKFTNEKYNTDNRQYQVVWDSGYANPIFAKACASVADKLFAMYPASFPTKDSNGKDAYYTKWGDYVSYRDNTGIDSPRTIFHAPVFKQMAVGNFMTTLPRSFSYLVSKINAYNSTVNEFMAIFGPNNAQISGGTQLVKFSLDEREELLGSQINTVITDSNGIYFNNNLTGQKVDSYLSEDMNIYQANLIAQVCEQYNPKILAKLNTPELWAKVKEDITGRINNRLIANKADKLNGFMVVCDGTLNTLQMIEQNTLIYEVWVMFNRSVKYVRAYVGVKRLGSF